VSRTKRFLSGIRFGYANQVITTLVGFWLTPFLLYRVGQHDYGLWLVGTQLIFYLSLLDLGIIALMPRETAFATGRVSSIDEAKDLPVIIGETVRIILWQMPLVALGVLIAWLILPTEWEGLRYPIGVVLLLFVAMFPLRIFNAVLNGLQDFGFLGRVGIASYLLSAGTTIGLVLAGLGLYALAIGWTVLQLTGAITGWYRLRTRFPGVLPKRLPKLRWINTRGRLKQGFWVSLNQIAQLLVTGTDILLIGKFFGPAAVVPYVCTGKLISVLANQPQLLMQLAAPALSQMRVAESRERLSQVCIALGQAMLMLSGAVVCIVLIVNQGFVSRWVGAGQFGGVSLTLLILLSMLLRHWNITIGYALFSFGRERRLCVTALLDGLISVGAVTLLVWTWGLIGAPLGMIIGACLVSLPANLSALAAESGMTPWSLMRPLMPWFTRFVFLLLIAGSIARAWAPQTWPMLALTCAGGALVYAAVMFPLTLRSPLGIYVRPRLIPIRARFFRALRLSNPA
jgi:O-antigen/teichoic acid export membrane protein